MADEPNEAPASQQDTPNPEQSETPQDDPYEKRYRDLQADFTRRTTEWSRYEEHPEEFMAKHGYEVEDPELETPDFDTEPYEALRAEVEQLKADREEQMSQTRAAALEEAEIAFVNNQLSDVLDEDREYSDKEIAALGDLSRLRRGDDGQPDVKAAHELIYGDILSKEKERWVQTKRAEAVAPGVQGGEKYDLDDPKQRKDYVAQRLAEIDADG